MVDFAGWSMPVQYSSIVQEHQATRQAIGMFDVSHMGRFQFSGPDAATMLDSIATRRVAGIAEGSIRYSLICNEAGGILDDVLIYRLPFGADAANSVYSMVVNASNREKIANWIAERSAGQDCGFVDLTTQTGMFAVQGPLANRVVAGLASVDPQSLKYYTGAVGSIGEVPVCLSRTGYTGEDGCEIICAAEHTAQVWQAIHAAGAELGLAAAGLGARDTLRLEAAMPLYGHELDEQTDPLTAGLGFAVNFKDRTFVGSAALAERKASGLQKCRVGLKLDGPRAAREGCAVQSVDGARQLGVVTSGTVSPTLGGPISMAYVSSSDAATGNRVAIDNRGKKIEAEIVELPFYQRPNNA